VKRIVMFIMTAAALLSLVSCSDRPQAARSEKPRVTSPSVPESDQDALAEGNIEFALDLYQVLREEEGNLVYSPHSISVALAMVYAGARGDTEQQMAEVMHFDLPQEQLHPAFNWLDLELAQRGSGTADEEEASFRLHIANAIWGQQGYEFLPEFLDTLAENYGAGLQLLDFGNPERARITINNWVADQTEDRIQDLIPPGVIDSLTRLVLTNAIYFNAIWDEPFDPLATHPEAFYLLNGDEISVPMMRQTEDMGYTEGAGCQAVELMYEGREVSMVILLPEAGELEAFEDMLVSDRLDDIMLGGGRLPTREVALTMPKFEFESAMSLRDSLQALGLEYVFSGSADLSGMTGNRELLISSVVHKAFIAVDEEGTEAAAATAVGLAGSAAPEELPIQVIVDRPFLFLIRDIETDTILFIGRVLDPSK